MGHPALVITKGDAVHLTVSLGDSSVVTVTEWNENLRQRGAFFYHCSLCFFSCSLIWLTKQLTEPIIAIMLTVGYRFKPLSDCILCGLYITGRPHFSRLI